jgi:predicted outer membrane repeat protein
MENHRHCIRFYKTKRERTTSNSTYPLSRTGLFSRYIFVFLSLFLITIPCTNAQICQPVFPPTLSRLHEILDDAGSYKVLCQFHISKDKGECDVKDAYKIKSVVNLVCRPEYGSSGKCVIDCPNTHFQIEPSAIAQFSGFEFRSATTSSIQVLPHGVFYSRNNIFVGNGSKEKGGAIYAQPNSGTSIVFTTFESNYASEGGAIYIGNKGVNVYTASTLLGNTFAVNYADVGGALYIDERVKLTLIKNTFYGNYIDLEGGLGPAIYYAGFLAKYCHGNYGCDNGRTVCDGGWNAAIQKCEPFETVCTYNPPTKGKHLIVRN